MKDQKIELSEKKQMLKARFDMLIKLNDSQQKVKMSRYKDASANKNIVFINNNTKGL